MHNTRINYIRYMHIWIECSATKIKLGTVSHKRLLRKRTNVFGQKEKYEIRVSGRKEGRCFVYVE